MSLTNSENSKNVSKIESYIHNQAQLGTLRFITCGSVDDGKSTLIGRLLYSAQLLFDDQLDKLMNETKKSKHVDSGEIDFSLLVDGLSAEREQGITIDVAYRFFKTSKRNFIVADTPGHEQYTRNMATGASTADLAVLLVDARKGILEQTKRHSYICSLLGIKTVIVAINKMDLVDYSEEVFLRIKEDYINFSEEFGFVNRIAVPVSALKGDNVVEKSDDSMPWYDGESLLSCLEKVKVYKEEANDSASFMMPIQWVNRSSKDFRGYAGRIVSGEVNVNDKVKIYPGEASSCIEKIYLGDRVVDKASNGDSVVLCFDSEVDASRGNVIGAESAKCSSSNQFDAHMIWMSEDEGFSGRSYILKMGTSEANVQISKIKHEVNVNTMEQLPAHKMSLNKILSVNLSLDRKITYSEYKANKDLGSFIIIDRVTLNTVAAGMVNFSLRRSDNIHPQSFEVSKVERRAMNGHGSKVIWLTGLSGAGKSTIANELEKKLYSKGIRSYVLDGDNIRSGLCKDLGFTSKDRVENLRRVAQVSKLFIDAGVYVIASFISPFEQERQYARSLFDEGDFIEVFVDVPLCVAESRDPKGLYKKARAGKLPNFTGISSPYEPPTSPEIHLNTEKENPEFFAQQILDIILKEEK